MPTRPVSEPADKPVRPYRGVNNEARVAERRARLIAAAIACFGTHGYHYTTLKMLCAEAGLTERYFYESFASFDELLCRAAEEAARAIIDDILPRMDKAGSDSAARLSAGVDAYLKAVAADKARARLILIEVEGASENATATRRRILEQFTGIIQRNLFGPDGGKPRNGLSPQILSNALLGAIDHLAKDWARAGFKPGRAVLVKNIEALTGGLLAVWDGAGGEQA